MKNYPIEVQIYVSNIMDTVKTLSKQICEDEAIENTEEFFDSIRDRVLIKASENLIDFDEPTLDEGQFITIINESVIEYHLSSMINDGLIKAEVNIETGENIYSLIK